MTRISVFSFLRVLLLFFVYCVVLSWKVLRALSRRDRFEVLSLGIVSAELAESATAVAADPEPPGDSRLKPSLVRNLIVISRREWSTKRKIPVITNDYITNGARKTTYAATGGIKIGTEFSFSYKRRSRQNFGSVRKEDRDRILFQLQKKIETKFSFR